MIFFLLNIHAFHNPLYPFNFNCHQHNITKSFKLYSQRLGSIYDQQNIEDVVDNFVNQVIGITSPGVVVQITTNRSTVFSKAYGIRDVNTKEAITLDDYFEWGSYSKVLVWASIMQLWEQGKIDLDEDIRKYLGSNFFRKLNDKVTILNLMHHNAGWEEISASTIFPECPDGSLKDLLQNVEPSQVFKPGEYVGYSNYGASIAGLIVETVSNMHFYEYVHKNIFQVLDMKNTSIDPSRSDINHLSLVSAHEFRGNTILVSPYQHMCVPYYPAGAAMGTVDDASKFISALTPSEQDGYKTPLFKNAETLRVLLNTSYKNGPDAPGISHGLWQSYGLNKTLLLVHGGNTLGFSASALMDLSTNSSYVIFANSYAEQTLTNGIPRLFTGYFQVQPDPQLSDAYQAAGSYESVRRIYQGIGQIYSDNGSTPVFFDAISNATLAQNTIPFYEYSPNTYQIGASLPISYSFIYATFSQSQVKSLALNYGDYIPYPFSRAKKMKIIKITSFIMIGISDGYVAGFILFWLYYLLECKPVKFKFNFIYFSVFFVNVWIFVGSSVCLNSVYNLPEFVSPTYVRNTERANLAFSVLIFVGIALIFFSILLNCKLNSLVNREYYQEITFSIEQDKVSEAEKNKRKTGLVEILLIFLTCASGVTLFSFVVYLHMMST